MTRRREPAREKAIAEGRSTYFTERACIRGHVAERYVSDNSCVLCRKENSREWFGEAVDERTKNARRAVARNATQIWRKRNRHRIAQKTKEWKGRNKSRVRAASERYRKKHRKDACARTQAWRAADPERARESKDLSRRRHPETFKAALHRRKARKRGAIGSYSGSDLKEIARLQKGKCAYCARPSAKLTVDHIVSLHKGGTNHRHNIQLACRRCNSRKGSRDPIEFARLLGKLL